MGGETSLISICSVRIMIKLWVLCLFGSLLYLLEKALAPHSSTLAWKILWMEEPGRLWSMGLLRVRHD